MYSSIFIDMLKEELKRTIKTEYGRSILCFYNIDRMPMFHNADLLTMHYSMLAMQEIDHVLVNSIEYSKGMVCYIYIYKNKMIV